MMWRTTCVMLALVPLLWGFQPASSDEDVAVAEFRTLATILNGEDCTQIIEQLNAYDTSTIETVMVKLEKKYDRFHGQSRDAFPAEARRVIDSVFALAKASKTTCKGDDNFVQASDRVLSVLEEE